MLTVFQTIILEERPYYMYDVKMIKQMFIEVNDLSVLAFCTCVRAWVSGLHSLLYSIIGHHRRRVVSGLETQTVGFAHSVSVRHELCWKLRAGEDRCQYFYLLPTHIQLTFHNLMFHILCFHALHFLSAIKIKSSVPLHGTYDEFSFSLFYLFSYELSSFSSSYFFNIM